MAEKVEFKLIKRASFFKTRFYRSDRFFGNIQLTTLFIRHLWDPNFEIIDCYPETLKPFYGRDIRLVTVGEFKKEDRALFVKPQKAKLFNGGVQTFSEIEPFLQREEDIDATLCYVSEPLDILAEYRCFVHKGELVGIEHCSGDFCRYPDPGEIRRWIAAFTDQPVAYCMDVGLTEDRQIIVEINDVLCCGTYGFDANVLQLHRNRYAEIIEASPKRAVAQNLERLSAC
ncbi:MAG: ATP-grasp domain-containing protein [Myxococcota bacterium]